MRAEAYQQNRDATVLDKLGVWLSARAIKRWVPSFEGKRVGDFGCGYHAKFASTIAHEAAAVVLADVALSDAVKALPNVEAHEGTLPEVLVAMPDQSLDVIMCISVLEHLWDAKGALKHIYRLLKPGGQALLNVPSWRGKTYLELTAFKLGLAPKIEMDDHKNYYDVKDLWPLLVEAGFLPSNIECFSHKFGLNTFASCRKA